jgi:hypothetical protein
MNEKDFKILEFSDVQPGLEKLQKDGWDSGAYLGFPIVANHYNMLPGSCTDWTGFPQSGKTEVCLEFLLNTSEFYGWKHLIFAPDIGTSLEIMAKLIHKSTGKTFIKKYSNHIDIKTAFNSCTMLLEHFKIIHKTNPKAKITPLGIWEYAREYKKRERLDTVMIDSWKDLHHDYDNHGGSYARYLSNILPIRNEIAEESKLHFHTIIHPKNPVRNKDGKVRPPSADDIEGGAQWNNSGKSIIAVHRENLNENVSDIYFRKIKPESVGRASSTAVCLMYDYAKGRYYAIDTLSYQPVFALKRPPERVEPIKPNISFHEPKKEEEGDGLPW